MTSTPISPPRRSGRCSADGRFIPFVSALLGPWCVRSDWLTQTHPARPGRLSTRADDAHFCGFVARFFVFPGAYFRRVSTSSSVSDFLSVPASAEIVAGRRPFPYTAPPPPKLQVPEPNEPCVCTDTWSGSVRGGATSRSGTPDTVACSPPSRRVHLLVVISTRSPIRLHAPATRVT